MTYKLTERAMQLARNPTACNWFQYFAQETWDRIGYARNRKGLKIWETTITQNLMFEFHTSKQIYSSIMPATWGIEILESVNESTNGNDIELFVEVNGAIIFFAVQAKIINHEGFRSAGMLNGNYPMMNHVVGRQNQIDLLCEYAARKGGVPLYLLYNYVKDVFEEQDLCNIDFEIEQYGCSIVNASYIKDHYLRGGRWTIPTFKKLHPTVALPWYVIPCCFHNKTKDEILQMLKADKIATADLTSYSLDEIRFDNKWKSISPFDQENEAEISKGPVYEDGTFLSFSPKFRVIVSPQLSFDNKEKAFK